MSVGVGRVWARAFVVRNTYRHKCLAVHARRANPMMSRSSFGVLQVNNHGGITTNYFTTYFDLVPTVDRAEVWKQMAAVGLEDIGDLGAFIYVSALAMYPVDDGTAMLSALTKCDTDSWCNEILTYNATMTTESMGVPHQTMSHPWGTAAIPAIVHGVMGITQVS